MGQPLALVIGDSHVDGSAFGKKLDAVLEARGYTVERAGVGATAARTWLDNEVVCRPDKSKCVTKADLPHGSDLLVICLGTNDSANAGVAGGDLDARADKDVAKIQQLAKEFGAKRTLWIGPPALRGSVQFYTMQAVDRLYAAAERAGVAVFDSRPATRELVEAGHGDGVHLDGVGSQAWATAIGAAMDAEARKRKLWWVLGGVGVVTVGALGLWWYSRRSR